MFFIKAILSNPQMQLLIKKLRGVLWLLRALFPSIYICFRKLPIRQAIKLPILVYKPKFVCLSGKFIIDGPVSFGLIILGRNQVSIYPNNGIVIENAGKIVFKGKCRIGNDSYITIGKHGELTIGVNSSATCALKLVCYHEIIIEDDVLIGWNNLLCDTDFHMLTNIKTGGWEKHTEE